MTPQAVPWASDERRAACEGWLARLDPAWGLHTRTLRMNGPDAGDRGRCLALDAAAGPLTVLDAPAPHGDVRGFVYLAGLARAAGLQAPEVLAADEAQGFLLLADPAGPTHRQALQEAPRADALMRQAIAALVQWQARVPAEGLGPCDEARLRDELALFPRWCVQAVHARTWSTTEERHWQRVCDALVSSALAQPRVAVHADWTPANLTVGEGGSPGVRGFQAAMAGPVTYDIASWLRDPCTPPWDEAQEIDGAVRWWQAARDARVPLGDAMQADFGECWRALEWMGLQRHLHQMGAWCRRPPGAGDPRDSEVLARLFGHATRVALRYGPLKPLLPLLEPLSGQRVATGFTF